jgi:hypothetical protein
MSDPLPAGTSLLSSSGCGEDPNGAPTFSLGTLPAGESRVVELTVLVDSSIAAGTILTNTATVSATTPDPEPSDDSAMVETTVAAAPVNLLDVDADGVAGALTDGLLVVRYLFGLRGDALVSGSLGAECERCLASEIETYLASITPQLDVDGDGVVAALTDGLLVLRWLFTLRGTALVSGAIDGDCVRCTPEQVEAYLDVLDG